MEREYRCRVPRVKARIWISVGGLAMAGCIALLLVRPDRDSEMPSTEKSPRDPISSAGVAVTAGQLSEPLPTTAEPAEAPPPPAGATEEGAPGPTTGYPVDLEELRARLPDNRYWELGAPTSDPEVARARAERAKRDNALFGRTQTGEATEPEIRSYYAERRRISEDYLRLSMVVLAEKGDELTDRDRGMFALSAKLHRERLAQIDRDLADALERRRQRHP
jgi:hypothetical protein